MNLKASNRGRKTDPGAPMAGFTYGVSADFDITLQKLDVDGNVIASRTPVRDCPNLITDYGLDAIGVMPVSSGPNGHGASFSTYLSVGTGGAVPAFTDTALATKVTHVVNGGVGNDTCAWDILDPDRVVLTRVFTFAVGAAAGALRELGLHADAAGPLTTRALFKDAFGDPTIVDVDSDEQLIVTYRIYVKPSLGDYTFVTTQNGTEYTITTRCSNIRSSLHPEGLSRHRISGIAETDYSRTAVVYSHHGTSSGLGIVTAGPTGTQTDLGRFSAPNHIVGVYTNGNYWRDDSFTIPLSMGNLNDIGAFYIAGVPFGVQIGISPRLNKTSLDTVKLTIRTSWARG